MRRKSLKVNKLHFLFDCKRFEHSICLEPGVIAKSSVVLDVKPWDDETDMQEMEKQVRTIEMDGLLWGACKSCISLVNYVLKTFSLNISQIGSTRVWHKKAADCHRY